MNKNKLIAALKKVVASTYKANTKINNPQICKGDKYGFLEQG